MNDILSVGLATAGVTKLLKIVGILGGAVVARIIVKTFISRLRSKIKKSSSETVLQAKNRVGTITGLLANAANFVISLIAIFLVLSELGVNIAPFLAGAGVIGLGIGMGMKDLAADMVAGFFILVENQINVGDKVQIGGSEGKIKKIGLRTLVLKDKEGKRHIIPNSSVKVIIKTIKKKK